MNDRIYKLLNEQIKYEFFSSFLYLSIASYFENIPLEGFAKWYKKQSTEEHEHGMKIYEYLLDRNCNVELQPIDKPPFQFNSVSEAVEMALKHEQKVTSLIHQLYKTAMEENDYATAIFLQWFITEQVEEEKNANDNFDQVKFIGDDKAALFVLDQNFEKKAS